MSEFFANSNLVTADWLVIAGYLAITVMIGLYFTRRAGKDMQSFFVSGRLLPWYISGISIVATSFASDTPLWITNLVRQYGIHYLWQYWAPAMGFAFSVVLFARLWRRLGLITDIEFAEKRYSGNTAAFLRGWGGLTMAFYFCPLVIGWVTKGMETIVVEAIGVPERYRFAATIGVLLIALLSCALSGLWGVVATSFMQFGVATVSTVLFAVLAIDRVGGLTEMVAKLNALQHWEGHALNFFPKIGAQMSMWNAIGYFGIFWWASSLVTTGFSGMSAQRVLACRDSKHASFAVLFNQIVYHAIVAWPWIIVALCSLILIPNLGEGIAHDNAYPRMIVMIMPVGLAGLVIVAMLAAFMSTISTMFNLGSSYLVNDVYQRFLVKNASPGHYVNVGRLLTVLLAVVGGIIAYNAENIQSLLTIMYVLVSGPVFLGIFRWFWWRITGAAEVVVLIVNWTVTPLMLFGKIFDPLMAWMLRLSPEMPFSSHPDLLGARILFMVVLCAAITVSVSLLTKPTDDKTLKNFILTVKPFKYLWKPVLRRLAIDYEEPETLGRTLISWVISVICGYALLLGIGKLLFGEPVTGVVYIAVFVITLYWTVKRINGDFEKSAKAVTAA